MAGQTHPIAVMDGTCALCAFGARMVHRLDRLGNIRIAPIQGETGAALMREHGLDPLDPDTWLFKDDALHARVAKYVKILREQQNLNPISERIVKSSISVFEAMNPVRNDQSFAHDNPDLVQMEEARFVFDSVTAFLRFSKAIDGRFFED